MSDDAVLHGRALLEQQLAPLSTVQRRRALELLKIKSNRRAQRLFFDLYPETTQSWVGPSLMGGLMTNGQSLYARSLYPKHMEWLAAGKEYRERCAMMANRVGKTFGLGGFELSAHLTGLYPDWWEGRRFATPISAWAAGDTYASTRDIVQLTLCGQIAFADTNNGPDRKGVDGRGIIPGYLLGRNTWHSGVQDLVDMIVVRHHTNGVYDGNSVLGLKSYDQGRKAFQGTGRHVIWFDEEPPAKVYEEALIRTATVGGIIMLTFTPLEGLSDVVLSFMPSEYRPEGLEKLDEEDYGSVEVEPETAE